MAKFNILLNCAIFWHRQVTWSRIHFLSQIEGLGHVGCQSFPEHPPVPARYLHLSYFLLKKRVKLKGNYSNSSHQWLMRQMTDPYVKRAKVESYRARSAFKLIEINAQHHLLKAGSVVVDCGAAPGSWTQVAVDKVNAHGQDPKKPKGIVVAVDLLFIQPIDGAFIISNSDFTHTATQEQILTHLGGRSVALVMSDMAPNASGIHALDHDNIIQLCKSAVIFSKSVLSPKGAFLCKLWDGHATGTLKQELRSMFETVKTVRPDASRKESSEIYILAKGFQSNTKR